MLVHAGGETLRAIAFWQRTPFQKRDASRAPSQKSPCRRGPPPSSAPLPGLLRVARVPFTARFFLLCTPRPVPADSGALRVA